MPRQKWIRSKRLGRNRPGTPPTSCPQSNRVVLWSGWYMGGGLEAVTMPADAHPGTARG